ncbi:ARM repeat-containing protein [Bimuria novae-zelandiae CBS 107.79]|uniref:ARM repeat-containing protein n=1 Tax=Bimuria novae-zelandiae CBS 107.79 TaxID=1447943 RepID=A0A6A5V493_9PLEO|nr:ARM repeat-containing protein [Bimuria novae-zelandiae CBS 107.79]
MAAPQAPEVPLALPDIEELVKTLYDPGHARKIPETEATLRVLQRSPQGWEIGDALLNSTDENVRFFGALTLTIKVNADSTSLSDEESTQLLSKLIYHLVTRPSSSVATRKLCSTLAQYFTKPISSWTECIRSLVLSFALQQPILDDALEHHPSTWDVIPQLPDEHLLTLLEFAMNLADETKKLSNNPDRRPHERMIANVESVEVLLQVSFGHGIKCLSTPPNEPNHERLLQVGEKLCVASLKCFLGWIFYAQSEFKAVPEKLRYLRSITELAFSCLEFHVDDAMEFVADVLEGYPKFFDEKDMHMLWAIITSQWGLDILKDLDAETVSLARIIVGYGTELVETKKLYQEPENAHYQQVLSFLHELLKYPEPVGVEDEVALLALDFWSTYICAIAEDSFQYSEREYPPWFPSARSNAFQAIAELLRKIIYPGAEVTKDWDSDSRKTFKVFRMDVRDITMEAFELLRNDLTEQFIDFSVHALEAKQWYELEAGLFCLISLADALTAVDDKLSRLFERPLFSTISENTDIPAVARRTAVDLVAAFNHFFMRNPQFLPQVLPFLLGALAQPSLAQGAAKSFASLCSECRKTLTSELPSFFQMYDQFLTYTTAEETTKSKVLEGIAAIVQAEASEEKQLAGLQHLLQYIAHDAMQALNLTKDGNDPEQGLVLALTALKCLSCVGRALQASDESVVDLDGSDNGSIFWTQGPGKGIQTQILNFITYLTQVFPANDEIIESACNVLRAGFKELVPGPFVLPPAAAVDYITRTNLQTPRLTYVLETACCWVSCHKGSSEFEAQAQRLLHYDLGIMQALQHPRNEPEVSVGCIELIQSFIKHHASILKSEHPDVLKGTFDFSIECIKSPEVLPKRAAAALWRDIIEKITSTGTPDQAMCQEIVDHFGQVVTAALIANICGEVDASSLEHVAIPLRKLIQNDRHSKAYVSSALAEQPLLQRVQGEQAVQDMVQKFTESLMRNAKNSTAFKEAVKMFWQSCKQLQMQFVPQTVHPGHRFNY